MSAGTGRWESCAGDLNNRRRREEEIVDSDDLLRMLYLAGKDAAREEAAEPAIITPSETLLKADASPTVLELDDWGLRRGREALRSRLMVPARTSRPKMAGRLLW